MSVDHIGCAGSYDTFLQQKMIKSFTPQKFIHKVFDVGKTQCKHKIPPCGQCVYMKVYYYTLQKFGRICDKIRNKQL